MNNSTPAQVSLAQIQRATANMRKLFKTTASVVIDVSEEFPLLVGISKDAYDGMARSEVVALFEQFLDGRKSKYVAWQQAHPQEEGESSPSTSSEIEMSIDKSSPTHPPSGGELIRSQRANKPRALGQRSLEEVS